MSKKNPLDVARYILFKCAFCGDLMTNLKMQKVLYYVYVWFLVNYRETCFDERFQAWPNGPVLRSVYNKLKVFGSSPIDSSFSEISNEDDLIALKLELGDDLIFLIDKVYEKYGYKSAFELVNLTHREVAWTNARIGLGVGDQTNNELLEKDILAQHDKKK
ncbi:hypothetical protein MNSC_08560 [Minisyncoccus archaeophilus]|uniref:Panacea domain-containing protein n=1 Tax=Minisyncoccus archaeiphilus TaxID=3238481 RepID=UPI00399D5594